MIDQHIDNLRKWVDLVNDIVVRRGATEAIDAIEQAMREPLYEAAPPAQQAQPSEPLTDEQRIGWATWRIADLEKQLEDARKRAQADAAKAQDLLARVCDFECEHAEAVPSQTAGMDIAQRILHVGGRDNAAGYVEFGSIQAVEALVRQVLRDLPKPRRVPDHELIEMYAECPRSDAEMLAFAHEVMARMLAAPKQAEAVPQGWKLVPVKPTEEMLDAGADAGNGHDWSGPDVVYEAMLAAAPQPKEQSK